MGYCPECHKEIEWLECQDDEKRIAEIHKGSLREIKKYTLKYFCPWCEKLIATTREQAEKILEREKLEARVDEYSEEEK